MQCQEFVTDFVSNLSSKNIMQNKLYWILETTGSQDAADLSASLSFQIKSMFQDPASFEIVKNCLKDAQLSNPILFRQLQLLHYGFLGNKGDKALLNKISEKEANLVYLFANFRPELEGKKITDNDIKKILQKEKSIDKRKSAWNASKEIGNHLAPHILELVRLRNEQARACGYSDYFTMQLALSEVDQKWLFAFFDELDKKTSKEYDTFIEEVKVSLAAKFSCSVTDIGPWAFSDPFSQEDPLPVSIDKYLKDADYVSIARQYFTEMGFTIDPILSRSDLFEREKKSQHAFCMNVDRKEDVRTLCNLKPTLAWMDTLLHELGHAVYELGFNPSLPYLLREPPHMIPTEAVALMMGSQVYREEFLHKFFPKISSDVLKELRKSLQRKNLLFSRWVFVMTYFEKEMYRDPDQDLQALWWKLVEKYQKITPSLGREKYHDWAAKYHIGLAPVYYYSYLIGDIFASDLYAELTKGNTPLSSLKTKEYLQNRLFSYGNTYPWNVLIEKTLDRPLSQESWIKQNLE